MLVAFDYDVIRTTHSLQCTYWAQFETEATSARVTLFSLLKSIIYDSRVSEYLVQPDPSQSLFIYGTSGSAPPKFVLIWLIFT